MPGAASGAPIMIEDQTYAMGQDLPGRPAEVLVRLQEHAAKLIPCPTEQTRVRRVPFSGFRGQWWVYLADGCGQRIMYGEVNSDGPDRYYVASRFSMMPPASR